MGWKSHEGSVVLSSDEALHEVVYAWSAREGLIREQTAAKSHA